MAEKIATRAAYGEALVALAEEYPELVVLDADLSGSTMTKGFAKAHPDRFYNMGIAEANMTGVAAGLAACGKKPFTNTFAMFAAGRAYEQVRNSIAYPRLNVKVVGSHGGLSVGEDGATHQCIEDYAIMRAIPNMMVVSPCDGPEMRQAVRALLDRGTDVAMPVLGDVSLFASSAYVAQLLEEEGCRCVRVPGVPSFCAAAARLGRSLTEMDLPVHIVPAGGFPLEEALDLPGTKVLMKSGRALPQVLEALESRGLLESSAMVQNCGLPGEQAAESLKDAPQSGSYFTTLLVP